MQLNKIKIAVSFQGLALVVNYIDYTDNDNCRITDNTVGQMKYGEEKSQQNLSNVRHSGIILRGRHAVKALKSGFLKFFSMIRVGNANQFECPLAQIFAKQIRVTVLGYNVMDMGTSGNNSSSFFMTTRVDQEKKGFLMIKFNKM